jgi:CPA2 family monovalent cation:H+ antiporter-2
MVHGLDLITTLAGGLTAALVFGFVAHKVRLSPIVGYLAGGIVVGPFTPGFVAHAGIASELSELGVVLLMFGVGLNLHVKELLAVRKVALPGALLAMAAAVGAGFGAARWFGWSPTAGVLFGLALSATSTVVLLRVFADRDLLQTAAGHIAIGWLLVEDVAVVLAVVLVPLLTTESEGGAALAKSIGIALAKVAGLVVFTIVVGRRVIPKLLAYVAATRSRELFTLAVLAIALGVALLAALLFGASMALGAFLAGLVVGQSEFGARAGSEALPMRDAFAVLFFVATGMLLDPAALLPNLRMVLVTVGVVFIAKPLVALVFVRLLGHPPKTAFALALGLTQIGEFSFMIAALGTKLGLLPVAATQVLVAVAMVTITANSLVIRLAAPLAARFGARSAPADAEPGPEVSPALRAIVVGFGPIGRSLARILEESGIEATIIDLNHETIGELTRAGKRAIYGDASQREILQRAGIARAGSLLHTASGPSSAVIQMAKELHPSIRVLTRAAYQRDVGALARAGADEVVSAEAELALAMAERLLLQLGATAEQVDRARDRVRKEVDPKDPAVTMP